MTGRDELLERARALHAEGLISDAGLARFEHALGRDEATPSEYGAFLDHIDARREADAEEVRRFVPFSGAELAHLADALSGAPWRGAATSGLHEEVEAEIRRRAGAG